MRELHQQLRRGIQLGRSAAACLTIAALLTLSLGQALHAAAATRGESAGTEAGLHQVSRSDPSQRAPHGADFCPMCRATAQTRLGVRVSACVGEIAASGICTPLQHPAPDRAAAAPALRDARPRAPPTALRVLSA